MSFDTAVIFDNQEDLTEVELYYINLLIKDGFEVRYDEDKIYNSLNGEFLSIRRENLVYD